MVRIYLDLERQQKMKKKRLTFLLHSMKKILKCVKLCIGRMLAPKWKRAGSMCIDVTGVKWSRSWRRNTPSGLLKTSRTLDFISSLPWIIISTFSTSASLCTRSLTHIFSLVPSPHVLSFHELWDSNELLDFFQDDTSPRRRRAMFDTVDTHKYEAINFEEYLQLMSTMNIKKPVTRPAGFDKDKDEMLTLCADISETHPFKQMCYGLF
ncbi:uncharacterized protein si:ch211-122l24.6 isoform X1 [Pseudorasbora parva]|uniref:uncharacterized protein si:ch211-122l24.6 isoform X1 n=1 Tax=Pseudorasbora parva TaxID=51549 RepID=UPI00351F742E